MWMYLANHCGRLDTNKKELLVRTPSIMHGAHDARWLTLAHICSPKEISAPILWILRLYKSGMKYKL